MDSTAGKEAGSEAEQHEPGGPPFLHRVDHLATALGIEIGVLNVLDSNIDRNPSIGQAAPAQSYGLVPSLALRYVINPASTTLRLDYRVARHSYTNTERWDRVSQQFRATVIPPLRAAFRAETIADVSLRGTSEDNDISDQAQLIQKIEYRFTRYYRLHGYGTLRYKRIRGDLDRNEFKPNVGLVLEQRLDGRRTWEIGVRYEVKHTEVARSRYRRWTIGTSYEVPLSDRGMLEFQATYRRKLYTQRFVEIEEEDYLRRDYQWLLEADWVHRLPFGIQFVFGYALERVDSKDPGKEYNRHAVQTGFRYRF